MDRKTYTNMLVRPKDDKRALYTIDLPPCISNRKNRNVFFFLIRYEKALDRKSFTILLVHVRPTDGKRAVYQSYFHAFRMRKKEKGNVSFLLIRYETALDRKTYISMVVRLQDDKRAIHH